MSDRTLDSAHDLDGGAREGTPRENSMTEKTIDSVATPVADTAAEDALATATAAALANAPTAPIGTAAVPGASGASGASGADTPAGAAAPAAGEGAVAPAAGGGKKAALADVEEAMKDVVDPELGINVVDLGLVYDTFVDDDNVVTLDMTLTSAACPLTDVIEDQTRQALTTGPGGGLANDVRINWVWLPPWGPDKITDDGREQLRALGFNV